MTNNIGAWHSRDIMAFKPRETTWLSNYSKEHVLYEIDLLRRTASVTLPLNDFERQVHIESFALHLRTVICFLYGTRSTSRKLVKPRIKVHDDDVIAEEFVDGWGGILATVRPEDATVQDLKNRADKELAHLTELRKNPLNPTKPWNSASAIAALVPILRQFHDAALKSGQKRMHPDALAAIKALLDLCDSIEGAAQPPGWTGETGPAAPI